MTKEKNARDDKRRKRSRHKETEAADFRFSILIFGEKINHLSPRSQRSRHKETEANDFRFSILIFGEQIKDL